MKITEAIKREICAIPESDIHAYAKAHAVGVCRPIENGAEWQEATPEESAALERLIYGAISNARILRNEYGDMTPNTIRACATTAEVIAHGFFEGVNCAETVFYPVIAWFRERRAYW